MCVCLCVALWRWGLSWYLCLLELFSLMIANFTTTVWNIHSMSVSLSSSYMGVSMVTGWFHNHCVKCIVESMCCECKMSSSECMNFKPLLCALNRNSQCSAPTLTNLNRVVLGLPSWWLVYTSFIPGHCRTLHQWLAGKLAMLNSVAQRTFTLHPITLNQSKCWP